MKSKFSLLLVLVLFLLASCNKEEKNILKQAQSKYEIESKIAKGLSLAILEDESIQKNLKNLCLKHRDIGFSDEETSLHLSYNEIVSDKEQKTLEQILREYAKVDKNDLCKLSGLSILLERNVNSESFDNEIYYNNGFDDSDKNATIPYFENGLEKARPISYNPNNSVFVVRISEAYQQKYLDKSEKIKIGKTICDEDLSTTKYDFELLESLRGSSGAEMRFARVSALIFTMST